MFNQDTDKEWEKFGKEDPYFGVITHDKFRKSNLTDAVKAEFFESGYRYIDEVLETIRNHIDPNFTIKRALDFGCGVGRLVIPLAKVAQEVTGIDVSEAMLAEAQKNCEASSLHNVTLIKSDDSLSQLNGSYNFIHSFIVFQHISPDRGEQIFDNLIAHLESEGICVVHFTYGRTYRPSRLLTFVQKYIPLSTNLINLKNGRKFSAPQMQMNTYNLNRLFLIIQRVNVSNCYMTFTDHGGELGVVIYFKRP